MVVEAEEGEVGCLLFSSPEHRVAQTHRQVTETADQVVQFGYCVAVLGL